VAAETATAGATATAAGNAGELALIEAIQRAIEPHGDRLVRWSGDDAAVVRARPFAVTSIDAVAEGVHFELSTHGPADVGWKALAAALSDLAAMGAEAGEAYVSLALPADFGAERGLALVRGMEELCGRTGTTTRRRRRDRLARAGGQRDGDGLGRLRGGAGGTRRGF